MGKHAKKGEKLSRKARKQAARRRQAIKNAILFWGLLAVCVGSLALMRGMNAEPKRVNTWYVQNGGVEIAAPAMTGSGLITAAGRYETVEDRASNGADVPNLPESRGLPEGPDLPEGGSDALPDVPSRASSEPTVTPTAAPTATLVPTAIPTASPTPEPVRITITAAGDCTLGGDVNSTTGQSFARMVNNEGYDYFLANVRQVFESDDLTIVNLEGPLTDVGMARTEESFCFKGKPEYVQILSGSSVELCNMANNHSRDFGMKGLRRTAEVLDWAKIGYCGYSAVYHTVIKGVRITALGYDKWNCKRDDILRTVAAERPNCDILIVNMHWGKERHYEPLAEQSTLGHAIIDAGADLIIGTHPHVYGGVELYKGKYIVYSLGNFCFGGNTNPADKRCLMFQQTFEVYPRGVVDAGINIIPCFVSSSTKRNNYQPTILPEAQGMSLIREVAAYSNFTQDGTIWMENSYAEQCGMLQYVSALPTLPPAAREAYDAMRLATGWQPKAEDDGAEQASPEQASPEQTWPEQTSPEEGSPVRALSSGTQSEPAQIYAQ